MHGAVIEEGKSRMMADRESGKRENDCREKKAEDVREGRQKEMEGKRMEINKQAAEKWGKNTDFSSE